MPAAARPWTPASHGIRLRATGVDTPPIYTYAGGGGQHLKVIQGAARAFVIDVSGHENDPWYVVEALAYGFFDLAYRETMRYQRTHVTKTTRTR